MPDFKIQPFSGQKIWKLIPYHNIDTIFEIIEYMAFKSIPMSMKPLTMRSLTWWLETPLQLEHAPLCYSSSPKNNKLSGEYEAAHRT